MSSTNSATSTLAGGPEPTEKHPKGSLADAEKGFGQPTYKGEGTEASPYIVTWHDNDPENPLNFTSLKKWYVFPLKIPPFARAGTHAVSPPLQAYHAQYRLCYPL